MNSLLVPKFQICCGLWAEEKSYLLKPEVFHHLFLPVRPSHHTFNTRHYVEFMRLVWVTSIFLMFLWSLSEKLWRQTQELLNTDSRVNELRLYFNHVSVHPYYHGQINHMWTLHVPVSNQYRAHSGLHAVSVHTQKSNKRWLNAGINLLQFRLRKFDWFWHRANRLANNAGPNKVDILL